MTSLLVDACDKVWYAFYPSLVEIRTHALLATILPFLYSLLLYIEARYGILTGYRGKFFNGSVLFFLGFLVTGCSIT